LDAVNRCEVVVFNFAQLKEARGGECLSIYVFSYFIGRGNGGGLTFRRALASSRRGGRLQCHRPRSREERSWLLRGCSQFQGQIKIKVSAVLNALVRAAQNVLDVDYGCGS